MKNLIFFCIALGIILLSIFVLNMGPVIKGDVSGNRNYDKSCKKFEDQYKNKKDKTIAELSDDGVSTEDHKKMLLDLLKEGKNKCYRDKAMVGLEYACYNFNIIFGFTCAILGLLNYLNIANNIKKNVIGLIGLITGIIGFVLTFIYVTYVGIIFNNDVVGKRFEALDYAHGGGTAKIKSDGSFAEWDDSKHKYVCIFYDKDNKDKFYIKYSDYRNKHLNYNTKDIYAEEEKNYEFMTNNGCIVEPRWGYCKDLDELEDTSTNTKISYYDSSSNKNNKVGECDKLYYFDSTANYKRQNIYDRWVTTIVLSYLIFVLYIGLAIFGFLLFRDPNDLKDSILTKSIGPISVQ